MSDIGTWIREGRGRIGLSQTDLALKLGTNQAYVSMWETGGRVPGPTDMKGMEELFGGPPPTPAAARPAQSMLPFAQEKPPAAKPATPTLFPGGVVVEKVSAEEFAALSNRKPGRPRAVSTPVVPTHPIVPAQPHVQSDPVVPAQPVVPPQPAAVAHPAPDPQPLQRNHQSKPGQPERMSYHFSEKVSFIWSVADLLRGDFKQSEYGKVILPFTVLRRLDQVLAATRNVVRENVEKYGSSPAEVRHQMVLRASGRGFYNTSKLDFTGLLGDPTHIASNLAGYVAGFSPNARDILEQFRFEAQIERLDKANLLFLVVQKFAAFDLDPDRVTNHEMGTIFEELIRKFAEASNETAGEHFTPREVIRLMVNLLFAEDDDALRKPGIVRTMFDPACGTGGMLSVAEEYLGRMNSGARLQVFGQELNDESYAICKADMLIKGQDADSIKKGNSFSEDGLPDLRVDYLISNPPFGVDWTKAENVVRGEHETRGYAGRFGPGLPRKNDGSLLFLLHMWSKRKPPEQGGSRLAIVFNGSPLFTGAAGSGESEIRRWVIENDWLEAIVALPDQMFYNTGISTYVWILSNRKAKHRKGKVQLINGVSRFQKMRKSLGDKRKELSEDGIVHLTRLYHAFEEGEESRIFANDDFGYRRITVERPLKLNFQVSPERIALLDGESAWAGLVTSKKKDPAAQAADMAEGKRTQAEILGVLAALDASRLYKNREVFLSDLKTAARRKGVKIPTPLLKAVLKALSERDETADVCLDAKGNPEPDTDLRDNENVPLSEDIDAYMAREVLPHVPDAWVAEDGTKIGYEIPFTRHFYVYQPPRPLEVIEKEIRELEGEIRGMLEEVLG